MGKPILIIQKNKKGKYFAQIQYEGKPLQPCSLFIPKDDKLNGEELDIEINPNKKGEILKIVCKGNILYNNTSSLINQVGSVTAMKTGKLKIRRDNSNISYNLFDSSGRKIDPIGSIKIENNIEKKIENKFINNELAVLYKDIIYNGGKPIIKKIIYKNGDDESVIYSNESHAPYNFVPLNTIIVSNDSFKNLDRTKYSGKSGYINLKITNKTPIYIRGIKNIEELTQNKIKSNFYSPTGLKAIPGSSIRGMVRHLVEIISFSQFTKNDKKKYLYFRDIANPNSSLGMYYKNIFTLEERYNNKPCYDYNVNSGFLSKQGNNYYILPSMIDKNFNTQFFRIEKTISRSKDFTYKQVKYDQNQIKKEYRLKNGFYLKELKINRLDDRNGTREGWLISSGSIKKKHMDWVINLPDNSQKILINEEDIESYQNDETRDDRSNIIQKLNSKDADRDFPMGIPCFYKIISGENGKTKVLFGHTALFRIPYKQSINDQIEKVDEKKVDYSNSIFGKVEENKKNTVAGRVFFMDAMLLQESTNKRRVVPKVLANPKPTTFQHYLEPNNSHSSTNYNTKIRGNKLYWHKNIVSDEWIEKEKNPQPQEKLIEAIEKFHQLDENEQKNKNPEEKYSQFTIIEPIDTGSNFTGKIHFENLSDEEIGCLLFALDLPPEHYHKIGMGKPLGLGSIEIKPELVLIDRKKRYESFSKDNTFTTGEERISDLKKYKNIFEQEIINKLKEVDTNPPSSLWEHPRIKELKVMLDWNKKPENKYTEYMQIEKKNPDNSKINEYRLRPILDKPSNYIKNIKD